MELLGIAIAINWILFLTLDATAIRVIVCFVSLILSILNLILNKGLSENRKTKIPAILFSIFITIESFIIMTPIIMFMININNLNNSISKLQEEKNLETYVYKKGNNYVFLDNKSNEIDTRDYDEVLMNAFEERFVYNININGHLANLGVAKKGNEVIIINSQGEEMFKLCNLFDDYVDVASSFMSYIVQRNNFGIEMYSDSSGDFNHIRNKNVLQRYIETDEETKALFNENENYEYMYFMNKDISLQVVIKKDEEEYDNKLVQNYIELDFNEELNRDMDKIEEFYKNKREYYLLNIKNGTKRQLECNNLIYDAYYDEENDLCENILLYSNGSIPFFDTEEAGYFEKTGEKTTISTSYLIENINENHRIIINKETAETYFMSVETNNVEKKIEDVLLIYNSFFIKCASEEDDEYRILDKNLNEIISSKYEPKFLGNNFMVVYTNNHNSVIYYYDNNNIKLIGEVNEFIGINSYINDIKSKGESIYYTVGIITYN